VSFQAAVPGGGRANAAPGHDTTKVLPSASSSAPTSTPAIPAAQTNTRPMAQVTARVDCKDGVIADIDASNKNYAARIQSENLRILSNPQCKATYAAQVENVARNLNKASNMSVTPEIIESQLTLLTNVYEHQAHNKGLTYATKRMLEQLCTKDGEFVGCFDSRTTENLKHYDKQDPSVSEIPGNLYRNIKEAFGLANDISNKFLSNKYNVDLYNFCQSIKNKDFLRADDCLKCITPDHAPDNCHKCKIYQHMLTSFNALRTTIFNEHDIVRSFEADTIWPQLKKVLDLKGADYARQVIDAQNQLAHRFKVLQILLEKVGKEDVPEAIKKFFYGLVSVYATPKQAAKYLSQLTTDSPDKNVRDAAALIFNDQYIPKIYNCVSREAVKDILLPPSFYLSKNRELRELYLNFVFFDTKNDSDVKILQQGARYIQQACLSDKYARTNKYFSDLAYDALTNANADKRILQWADFSQVFTNPAAKEIQQRVLPALHNAVGDWHLPVKSTNQMVQLQQNKAGSIVHCISAIYTALASNDIQKALDIEKNELPCLTRNFIIEDLQKVVQPPFLQTNREHILAALCHTAFNQPITHQDKNTVVQCTTASDKSKNLEKAPGACLPKNPGLEQQNPGCKLPESKDVPWSTCPDVKIKSDLDRRLEQELEDIKKKAQEAKREGNDCNWSKGKHLPSLRNEPQKITHIGSPAPNASPNQEKEIVVIEERLQQLKKRLVESQKKPATQEEIKLIDQFIERLRKLTGQYGVDAVAGAVGVYGATKIAQSAGDSDNRVNQDCVAILKDGYYEVNGFKFTEYYYKKLWEEGRKAPSLVAQRILEKPDSVSSDSKPVFLDMR
jgi:hypothetical protein